jgi:lantibiotic modifying enzyme
VTSPVEEALRIARRLAGEAVWHRQRCCWMGPARRTGVNGATEAVVRPLDASLYSGTAGVALFLAEAASLDGDSSLAATAIAAMRHGIEAAARPGWDERTGLYTGRVGVALAAHRVGELTGDSLIVDAANDLLTLPRRPSRELDLLGGLAGTALGLLAVDASCGSHLDRAIGICEEVVAEARVEGGGVSWATGRAEDRHCHLLGMAHGASGIAYALATVGVAAGREDLIEVARSALAYEREHFSAAQANWPDFRSSSPPPATGVRSFMWAWCHGAPGAALARIPLAHRDPCAEAELVVAVESTIAMTARMLRADDVDFGMCHGAAGNADIALTCAARSGRDDWRAFAQDVAGDGIERFSARRLPWPCGIGLAPDPTLLTGVAGVGHFLLRTAFPEIPTVLAITPGFADVLQSPHKTRSSDATDGVR